MGDMIDEFNEKSRTLKTILPKTPLTPEQKKLVLMAMDLGYAAAFCERTCDMRQSYDAAQRFKNDYNDIRELLG